MTEKRERWRMTLQELCHRTGATPQELNEWAKLGVFGPAWAQSTENKWRHVTKAVARRAIVMRHLLDRRIEPLPAAMMAWSAGDRLAKGEKVAYGEDGKVVIELDPEGMDLP